MVLAVELEKRISKSRIVSAYLCKIYWGRGIYGVKSASKFYFGKHPSLLTLGECALLVGTIPAPELRSPFRDYSRGKSFQAKVLKRMVDGGFLDVDAALSAIRRSDSLKPAALNAAEHSLLSSMTGRKMRMNQERDTPATVKEWWEWERESCIWEVREETEEWAMRIRTKEEFKKTNTLLLPSNKERLQLLLSVLLHPISPLK